MSTTTDPHTQGAASFKIVFRFSVWKLDGCVMLIFCCVKHSSFDAGCGVSEMTLQSPPPLWRRVHISSFRYWD